MVVIGNENEVEGFPQTTGGNRVFRSAPVGDRVKRLSFKSKTHKTVCFHDMSFIYVLAKVHVCGDRTSNYVRTQASRGDENIPG